jgi:hypothetical protein
MPETRFARSMGQSGANERLTDGQELAVCLCLGRLDAVGTSPMVTSCANLILKLAQVAKGSFTE